MADAVRNVLVENALIKLGKRKALCKWADFQVQERLGEARTCCPLLVHGERVGVRSAAC